jgi:hypothetical protein
MDFRLPLISAKKIISELKAGTKFPKRFSPENDLLQLTLITFELDMLSNGFGSSKSTSPLSQNLRELNEEHDEIANSIHISAAALWVLR